MLLNPLAEKFRSLLPPGKIIYVNECGGSIAGRNCSCDPHTSPICGGCDAGHPAQPPLRQISPALTHISIDMYEGYGPCLRSPACCFASRVEGPALMR